MALDKTDGTRHKKKKKPAPQVGFPSQTAAEAVKNNHRKKKGKSPLPTPAINAGTKEAKRRKKQARAAANRKAEIALAHLKATLHEPMLDPWHGMGNSYIPSPEAYKREIADIPDYRTYDWKDANIPVPGFRLYGAGTDPTPGPTTGHVTPRQAFEATVWNPDAPIWENLAWGATWFTGPFKAFGAAARGGKALHAGEGLAGAGRAARAGHETPIRDFVSYLRGHTHNPRELQVGERTVQLPRARSRLTQNLVEKPSDAVSRAIDDTFVEKLPLLKNATASRRAVKAAGRLEVREADRAANAFGRETKALLHAGSDASQEAHWWWAQLPKEYRNAEGLKLVRGKLVEQLDEIRSGRMLEDLNKREALYKSEVRRAWNEADAAQAHQIQARLEDVELLKADLPQRVEDISKAVARLDKIIAKTPKLKPEVIDAIRSLSEDRKATLIKEGALDPERAATREGLVSRWLGLETTGDEIYLGHRMAKIKGARPSLLPGSVATGRVTKPEGVAKANKLVLANTGRARTDLKSVVEDWQAAKVYSNNSRIREDLAQMGKPLKGTRVPEGHVLINPKGRAIPKNYKLEEDLSDEEVVRKARSLVDEFYASDDDKIKEMLKAAEGTDVWPELRVLREDLAQRYFDQIVPAGRAGKALNTYDHFVDLVSASIIFGRIGYIPKNVLQNLIMAAPHQGAYLLTNAVRAGQIRRDPELWSLIRTEIGSGATHAIEKENATQKGLSKVIGVVGGVADDPLRITAWVHEAASKGIISSYKPILTSADRAKLLRVLRDKESRPLLNDVHEAAVNAMGDFTRMTPAQRKAARRLLIIPGWLMAGTRYPFHFAATHPVRSALLAYVAMGEPGAPERLQLNDPITSYFEGENFLRGIDTPWGRERTASISPVSTPWQVGGALYQTAKGVNPYDYSQDTAFDYANPLLGAGVRLAQGEGVDSLKQLAPNVSLAQDLMNPEASKYYPEDATRLGRLKREVGILPIDVNDFEKKDAASFKSDLASLQADYKKQTGENVPQPVVDALKRKWAVRDAEKKLQGDNDKLTEAQRVAVRMNVAYDTVPEYRAHAAEWANAYKEALGNPLDFPHGEGDEANGPMHALQLYIENNVLGYSALNFFNQAVQKQREAAIANG